MYSYNQYFANLKVDYISVFEMLYLKNYSYIHKIWYEKSSNINQLFFINFPKIGRYLKKVPWLNGRAHALRCDSLDQSDSKKHDLHFDDFWHNKTKLLCFIMPVAFYVKFRTFWYITTIFLKNFDHVYREKWFIWTFISNAWAIIQAASVIHSVRKCLIIRPYDQLGNMK